MKKPILNPPTDLMSIIRIAPVCNGKIYVTPHPTNKEASPYWDLPIEEQIEHFSPQSEKAIRKVKERYNAHLQTTTLPRFSVKYCSTMHGGKTVYLYILPLNQENEISFHFGQFISIEEITSQQKRYSTNLCKEKELLGMAAELWKDFPPL